MRIWVMKLISISCSKAKEVGILLVSWLNIHLCRIGVRVGCVVD